MAMDAEKQHDDTMATIAGYWAARSKLMLPNNQLFTFQNHEYLFNTLGKPVLKTRDKMPQKKVKKKATQVGGSVSLMVWCFHSCIYGIFPQGIGYIMPSDPEVQGFSKTKFNPMIASNPLTIGKYVKSSGRGAADSAELKKVGGSFLFFKSASSNKKIQGENQSSNATSFSCDAEIFDEVDMMDNEGGTVEKFEGRVDHSDYKILIYLSNPTLENYGIDALFQESDQRYWYRLCPSCLKYTCPDLEFLFEQNIEKVIRVHPDGRGYIACKHCGAEIPLYIRDSKSGMESTWVAQYPDRPVEGEHYSHLMTPRFHDPYKLLQRYYAALSGTGSLKEILRKDFGRAYTPKEDQLRPSDVRECCGSEPMAYSHKGPCIMGVDVMNTLHYVIGFRTGPENYEIIKAGVCKDFKEQYDIARKFNVKYAGIDVAPDVHAAKTFQASLKAIGCKAYLVDYRVSRVVSDYGLDEKAMIIKANRTEAMDHTHNLVINKQLVLPRKETCEELIKQICNIAKLQIMNAKTGLPEYVYRGKNEHFRHSLNYMVLAGKVGRAQKVSRGTPAERQTTCVN